MNNTLYDAIAGKSVGLDLNHFLETRRLDIFALTDALLNPSAAAIPEGIRGKVDEARIGMMGHSFGALTTAYGSTRDPRIKAIAILAMLASTVPEMTPYVGPDIAASVQLQPVNKPALFVLAQEDIIAFFGLSDVIRQNFNNIHSEAWLASMADAGHYSVTDICGINLAYSNGCGSGLRATKFLEPFTYLDIRKATNYAGQFVTAFFEKELLGASSLPLETVVNQAPNVLKLEHHVPTP